MNETENSCAGVVLQNGLTAIAMATSFERTQEISDCGSTKVTKTETIRTMSSFESTIVENTQNSVGGSVNAMDETYVPQKMRTRTSAAPMERICLVGSVAEDYVTVNAARTLNVPIELSSTGEEFIGDTTWTTYFVMNDFEGPTFDAIRKSKHRIYGPPALRQVADSKDGLTYVNRPIYNFAMKSVITCFTGIRKKDELTRLVNLIHSMGGSIRKELNSKVTHLICNSSSGEKYRYAMTFRLTVVRACWVYDAWERRNDPSFSATAKVFTDDHRLKVFEGQRICFFGFPPDEHQHMIEVLKDNGGIPTDMEDPECSHVILSNSADQLPETLGMGATSPQMVRLPPNKTSSATSTTTKTPITVADKFSPPDGLEKMNLNDNNGSAKGIQTIVATPKKSRKFNDENCDGVVVMPDASNFNDFLEPANISPILHNIEEEEENGNDADDKDELMAKRKRDSFDNISIISTDSFAPVFNSAKKPKLIRSASITRSLRRSMSFVALKNPITNMIRVRRSSIDPNASINSITSMESTFSESIKRPVKEKLLNFKDRFMKNGNRSKREFCQTPKSVRTVKEADESVVGDENDKFLAPDDINAISCRKMSNSTMIETPAEANRSISGRTIPAVAVNENEAPPKDQSDHADTTSIATSSISTRTRSDATVMLDDDAGQDKQELKNSKTHIVKSEWFWYTIQNGYADESDYLFGDYLESIAQTPGGDRRESLPMSLQRRKRKRFSIRNAADSFLGGSGKRRSSVSDAGLSVSGSFLDYTASPSCKHDTKGKAQIFSSWTIRISFRFFPLIE